MQPLVWMLTVLLAAPVQDPVQVSASLTRDRITVGEASTLQVTVNSRGGSVDQIRTPALPPELDVLGTSDFSQTQISVPGGRSRVTRRDILLSSRTPGVYRIPAITVDVDGTSYRTNPLTLVVSAGSGYSASPLPLRPSGAPATSSLTVAVSPDTVYVGQQVLLRAEVTFSDDVRTRQSRPASFDPPAPAGFWVQELPDPVTVVVRVRDGRPVESQTYRRAYFPLNAGEFVFPPAHLYYDVRRGFLSPPESRRLSSDSTRLVVLPLPHEGRPENFGGAVGRLEVRASLRPQRIAVGEATVLEVELQGHGNVKGLPEPVLPRLAAAEVFTPSQESQVEVVSERVGGTKRFRWVVVPQQPGELLVPPIEYSYFDPELEQYVRLQTEPLELVAEPRPGDLPRVSADTALRPLRTGRGGEPAAWALSPLFAAAQLLPLLFVAAVLAVRRQRHRPAGPREHERRIREGLASLRSRRSDAAALAELEWLLHEMVHCLTDAAGQDSVSALRAQQRTTAADELAGLLADLQHARYSPDAAVPDMPRLLDRAERLLRLLAPRRRWRRAAAAAATVVVLSIGALLPYQPVRAAAGDDPFTAGVASYGVQDWVAAANNFQEYTRLSPRDPNGWYNLGLAAQRAGDPGRAVWAWLRAARIAPRDADVHHNLRLVDASAAVAEVRPVDRLAAGERAVVAAAAWWLLVLAVGLAARPGFRRAAAGAAAALLLVTALAAAAGAVRPAVITPLHTGAPLFAAPTDRDDEVGRLHVGAVIRVLERRDEWLLVAAGPTGRAWVERAAVATP
jgi:tetratricopeptide (TPR) repeat protein